ncbi:unnamed protein product, partial [Didymodactylos carnosus]
MMTKMYVMQKRASDISKKFNPLPSNEVL